MLPANLAKTRTAGRGTYGELVVLSGGPSGSSLGASVGQPTAAVRYTPYPLPATTAGHQHASAAATQILPLTTNPTSIIQYAAAPSITVGASTSNLYADAAAAALSYKRLLATTAAAAAALRSHHHHHARPQQSHAAALTYPLGDLLGVQGLDLPGLYQIPTATIGL